MLPLTPALFPASRGPSPSPRISAFVKGNKGCQGVDLQTKTDPHRVWEYGHIGRPAVVWAIYLRPRFRTNAFEQVHILSTSLALPKRHPIL